MQRLGRAADALVDLRFRQLLLLEAEGDVLPDTPMRIERIVLEHHSNVALAGAEPVDDLIADDNVAAGDVLQSGDRCATLLDLPQPEGPTKTTNSLSSIVKLMPRTAS